MRPEQPKSSRELRALASILDPAGSAKKPVKQEVFPRVHSGRYALDALVQLMAEWLSKPRWRFVAFTRRLENGRRTSRSVNPLCRQAKFVLRGVGRKLILYHRTLHLMADEPVKMPAL